MNNKSPSEGLPARRAALHALFTVIEKKQPLDQYLEQAQDFRALETRDRSLARMLCATTLRRAGQIDTLIQKAMERDTPPDPPALHHLLRLGAAQLLFMEVDDYAAVDTAVELADARHKGLVNAVLRRIAREKSTLPPETMNIPAWLHESWTNDYGAETANAIALASLQEAPLDLSVKNSDEIDHWAKTLDAEILPGGTLRKQSGGRVTDLAGYTDGAWWVQDAAAAWPARLLGDIRGKTVLDLCAAPGGKTAQLAGMGANVVAIDRSEPRLRRLEDNMKRLNLTVTTVHTDILAYRPTDKADFILLDAPCSATGTLRRHPDALHLKLPEDIVRLGQLQSRLLDHAATMLAPGGTLIYCTCSLQKAEGEAQIEAFLKRTPSMIRRPIAANELGGIAEALTSDGDVRILPTHGMDGFFIARLIKI